MAPALHTPYDSFGNLVASTGTLVNSFRYTGREFDAETGPYYYRTRYHDPSTEGFVAEDPLEFFGVRVYIQPNLPRRSLREGLSSAS